MDNQEAIASLKTLCHTCKLFPRCAYKKPECFKAIEMAISALQAQDVPDINDGDMEWFYDGHKDQKQDTKGDVNEK